jgi:hypothetical protein
MAPNATTYALRVGSVIAGVALFVLLVAPGSRADDAAPSDDLAVLRAAEHSSVSAADVSTTVATTIPIAPSSTIAPTTVAPSTVPAPSTAPKPAGPTTARVLSVFDIVGVPIDRGTTWIAIATVTIIDQTGAPAANIDVTGSWSVGPTPASCRTDVAGKCSMYQSPVPGDVASTTIAITAPQKVSKPIFRSAS